ncbi:hypothetical protein [Actimicrobium sp. CCI2.3]|uniref:hypothetical protein n=1 Tax=Actimicrobium sp. CCI2.3 TaxID=3048616 RepID=UPI002AB50520|nr:hypothetical protein [Actimicrobium sp. CCI2.3]MDY7576530.1 hypothetical protein [Actimicrobium sp. CCI2.3]MEB0021493.1 hypothetical protein [Actimicrobium sp. CCI2.3]
MNAHISFDTENGEMRRLISLKGNVADIVNRVPCPFCIELDAHPDTALRQFHVTPLA